MNDNGTLIVFEGISGAGKGTQIEILERKLESHHVPYVTTHWNSDNSIAPLISKWKKERQYTPLLWSTVHAIDLLKRYIEVIEPALNAGSVVIADRYVPTALCRDLCRGVPENFVRSLYSFARKPDYIFYLDIEVDIAYQRRLNRYPRLGFYSSGCDFLDEGDMEASWKKYAQLQKSIYASIKKEFDFITINAKADSTSVAESIQAALEQHR